MLRMMASACSGDRFERDWRDRRRALPAPGIGRDVGQLEKLPASFESPDPFDAHDAVRHSR
jgi:hypothetical protein